MEKRELRLHKEILWSVIQSQAGSLEKAVLELVMNSVDAGATRVQVSITNKTISVEDDGRGFADRKTIEDFFETFGTPHVEGDATYGKFRMGRGQVMAFTKNRWKSGRFIMAVDIKNQGLFYDLSETETGFNGCLVEGVMYEPLKPSELLATCRAFSTMCQYAPVPVILNGELISEDPAKTKWTLEDDCGYYLLRPDAYALVIYNQGIKVCEQTAWSHGIGGVVISKKRLEVNFARNDILLTQCKVWKQMSATIKAHAKSQDKSGRAIQNETWRRTKAQALLSGDYPSIKELLDGIQADKVITDVNGNHRSLAETARILAKYGNAITDSPEQGNLKADKLHQSKVALVVAPSTLDRFGVKTLSELWTVLEHQVAAFCQGQPKQIHPLRLGGYFKQLQAATKPFSTVSSLISDDHFLVPDNELSGAEKVILRALDAGSYSLLRALHLGGESRELRALRVGESETARAWTNGQNFIAINRDELKIHGQAGGALTKFFSLITLLVHEYLHTNRDDQGHIHDAEFYQAYERVVCNSPNLGGAAHTALTAWLSAVTKNPKLLNGGAIKELDRQAALAEVESPVPPAEEQKKAA